MSSVLEQHYAGLTGNNPADLGEIDADILRKKSGIDLRRGNDDLVLLTRSCSVEMTDAIDAGDSLEIDFNADLARGSDVAEIG